MTTTDTTPRIIRTASYIHSAYEQATEAFFHANYIGEATDDIAAEMDRLASAYIALLGDTIGTPAHDDATAYIAATYDAISRRWSDA